ncbi:energy transducer TonB [Hymenobacter profundi]|uniref:TonB family protein n=1 Tax=Hymenobacter profundi TaxID=1982110 RepID=A0ABS6X2H3_9BACT|nr:energy transducer TonB [Hymenobacter profundi]MBW3130043.1 TonB family protein [Hymenobacter profundi]
MKKFYVFFSLLIVGCFSSYHAAAQINNEPHTVKEYFDADGKKLPSTEGAVEWSESIYQDSIRGVVQGYYGNGQLKWRSECENIRLHTVHGISEMWYESGQLRRRARVTHGKWDGELVSYHANGTLKRREVYKEGESVSGECFDNAGKPVAFYAFEKMPSPPLGGFNGMLQFIGKNLRYPAEALRRNIQGKVFIDFYVDTLGVVRDVRIKQGIHPSIDNEAARVIASLPAWEPGYQDGNPVNVSFTVPVTFAIQDKKIKKRISAN